MYIHDLYKGFKDKTSKSLVRSSIWSSKHIPITVVHTDYYDVKAVTTNIGIEAKRNSD